MARFARKLRTYEHIIADLSMNYVERLVFLCGYSAERTEHDYGTDLVFFTYDEQGEVENGQIYVQLKATDMLPVLVDKATIAFPVSHADLLAWLDEPMPYILVVYDAKGGKAYWTYIQAYFERLSGFVLDDVGAKVTVHIPMSNVLDEDAIRRFAVFRDSILAQVKGVVHYDD